MSDSDKFDINRLINNDDVKSQIQSELDQETIRKDSYAALEKVLQYDLGGVVIIGIRKDFKELPEVFFFIKDSHIQQCIGALEITKAVALREFVFDSSEDDTES